MRKRVLSWRSNLLLSLFTLIALFLGLELTIRSYDAVRGRKYSDDFFTVPDFEDAPAPLAAQVFDRNLRLFAALEKANDIKVLLGNQPLQLSEEYFVRHMEQKPYNDVVTDPLHEEFLVHLRAFNKIIEQVAEDTQMLFIDNETELGTSKSSVVDFVHYTPKRVRRLANNYAQFLIGEKVIEVSTDSLH